MNPDQTQLVLYMTEDGVKAAALSDLDELPALLQELEEGTVRRFLPEIPAWAHPLAQNLNRDGSRWALVAGPSARPLEPRLSPDDLAFLERLRAAHHSADGPPLSEVLLEARAKLKKLITSIDFEGDEVIRNLQYVVTLFLTDNLFREQGGSARPGDGADPQQEVEPPTLEWDRVYLLFGTAFEPETVQMLRSALEFYHEVAGVPVEVQVVEERSLLDAFSHERPPGGKAAPDEALICWRGQTLGRLRHPAATRPPNYWLDPILRAHAPSLLTPDNLGRLLDRVGEQRPHLIGSLFDASWSIGSMLPVMRDLLKQGLLLQPLTLVLEKLLEFEPGSDRVAICTGVRRSLGSYIAGRYSDGSTLPVVVLKPSLVRKLKATGSFDRGEAEVLDDRLLALPHPLLVPPDLATAVRIGLNPLSGVVAEDEIPRHLTVKVVGQL